jgi:glycosyltransferase involved in cell wall biosynthesis
MSADPTILINGRFLAQPVTGVQRYSIELLRTLDQLLDEFYIDLGAPNSTTIKQLGTEIKRSAIAIFAPSNIHTDLNLKHIPIHQVGYLKGHLWEQIELPFYSRDALLINLGNTAPFFKRNQTVVIHDASVFAIPEAYIPLFSAWYQLLYKQLGKVAKQIITVSNFSKAELVKYCQIDPAKVQVAYLGKEHISSQVPDLEFLKQHGIGDRPFCLAVSSPSKHKNFGAVLEAIALLEKSNPEPTELPFEVIVVGQANLKIFDPSTQSANTLDPIRSVRYLGSVSDRVLKALYQTASCLIYPSLYEGFGLPPLEAMTCGCPVITSNSASLPEVCGDAVLYCDPHNPDDIAGKIQQLIGNKDLREDLRRRGLIQAEAYSWRTSAQMILTAIAEHLPNKSLTGAWRSDKSK